MSPKTAIRKLVQSIRLHINRCFKTEILVLGDSHAEIFNTKHIPCAARCFWNVVAVPGATVSGLKNPRSKTQAGPIFEKVLRTTHAKKIIAMLGEVDTGFVIWYRSEKHQEPIEQMLEQALGNYEKLLIQCSEKAETICISTPLPTIQDGQDWGEIANLRKEIKANQKERTRLTLEFNRRMQEICRNQNIPYISLDTESLAENGLVTLDLLSTDPENHHYDDAQFAKLLIRHLAPIFPSLSSQPHAQHTTQ